MRNGAGTPFIYVEDYMGRVIHEDIIDFTYVFSEKSDDFIRLVFQFKDPNFPDSDGLQEQRYLLVQWGYKEDKANATSRKCYIREIIPDYRQEGMFLEVKCTDKASYMKEVKPRRIHNGNPLQITQLIADEYGLEVSFELYTSTLDTTIDKIAQRVYVNYPQPGINDMRFLNDLWAEQEGGPYSVVGRGDQLIITRLSLNQKPKKTYVYNKEPYTLLAMRPQSKNRRYWKKANKNTVQYYDPITGEMRSISIDALNDRTTRLGDIDVYNKDYFVSAVVKNERDTKLRAEVIQKDTSHPDDAAEEGGYSFITEPDPWKHGPNLPAQRDHTSTLKVIPRLGGSLWIHKQFEDTRGDTPWDEFSAKQKTLNDRQSAANDINPGNAITIGDPALICSTIVTFLGLSKKYSGNYYVTKVTHRITKANGFINEIEFKRNSKSKTGNEGPGATQIIPGVAKINKAVGGYTVVLTNGKRVKVSTDDVDDYKLREKTSVQYRVDNLKNKEYDRYNNPFPEE